MLFSLCRHAVTPDLHVHTGPLFLGLALQRCASPVPLNLSCSAQRDCDRRPCGLTLQDRSCSRLLAVPLWPLFPAILVSEQPGNAGPGSGGWTAAAQVRLLRTHSMGRLPTSRCLAGRLGPLALSAHSNCVRGAPALLGANMTGVTEAADESH